MDERPDNPTTPPVHQDGPPVEQREIAGGTPEQVGLDSALRSEFERVANDVAARNTRTVIAVPVRQLVEATVRVVQGLPRVPDYDPVVAAIARWEETTDYSPVEVPDCDPAGIGVEADGAAVVLTLDNVRDGRLALDADHAEGFFLAGLAAVRAARVAKDQAERDREQGRGVLVVPERFRR